MKVLYRLIKDYVNERETYGVEITKQIRDVFKSECEGKRFVALCNELKVSEVHIEDILHDYLLEQENVL